jgi:hypothetical protein
LASSVFRKGEKIVTRGNSKPKRRGNQLGIVTPPPERLRHGPVERITATVKDTNGRVGAGWRALDTLEIMLRRGSLTKEMCRAGNRFHQAFVLAGLEPLTAADPTRLPVLVNNGARRVPRGNDLAHRQVMLALRALGGTETTLGSCAWHVLGREMSLREWSIHRGWNHRPVNFAAGVLVSTLDLLRIHYGETMRPSEHRLPTGNSAPVDERESAMSDRERAKP